MKIHDIEPNLFEATDVSQYRDPNMDFIDSQYYLNKLELMMAGALKGVQLANKLKNKEEKLWHLHNVFTNLNKIRGAISFVSKII